MPWLVTYGLSEQRRRTPPPGDGCAEAQGWVDRILNPPPPNPDAPAPSPRAELTVADLPLQCRQVIETK